MILLTTTMTATLSSVKWKEKKSCIFDCAVAVLRFIYIARKRTPRRHCFQMSCNGLFTLTVYIAIFATVKFLPPATKLGQGYVFTGVCDSVNGGGGCLPQCMLGYTPRPDAPPGTRYTPNTRYTPQDQAHPRDQVHPRTRYTPPPATTAGGTHPTGMHSCIIVPMMTDRLINRMGLEPILSVSVDWTVTRRYM